MTVVGLVTHVDQQSTKVSYTVDDRTGPPLEGHIFATEPEVSTSRDPFQRKPSELSNSGHRSRPGS